MNCREFRESITESGVNADLLRHSSECSECGALLDRHRNLEAGLGALAAELRRNPRDPKILKRWSRNNLIVQVLCAAVGLIGFAMQLLGAAMPVAFTLYAIAVAYLILLRPVKP